MGEAMRGEEQEANTGPGAGREESSQPVQGAGGSLPWPDGKYMLASRGWWGDGRMREGAGHDRRGVKGQIIPAMVPQDRISPKESLRGTECHANHALLISYLAANYVLLNIPVSSGWDSCLVGLDLCYYRRMSRGPYVIFLLW